MALNRLLDLWRDKAGHATFLFAGSMTSLVAVGALVVDAGSLFVSKRRLQGMADAAALGSVGTSSPQNAIQDVIASYGADTGRFPTRLGAITHGNYAMNTAIAPQDRFQTVNNGGNAIEVTLNQSVPLFFAPVLKMLNLGTVTAKARASKSNLAAFSLGSTLVGLQGGIANSLLSNLTGSSINLSVMSYDALASANVDLLTFSNALRTGQRLSAVSYTETLNTQTTLPIFLQAMASAVSDSTAANALNNMAAQVPSGTTIVPANLINLGPTGLNISIPGNTQISVNAFTMLREALTLANGEHQVTMDLGATVPGLAATKVTIITGSRMVSSPWIAVAPDNTVTVYTQQMRLLVNSSVGATLPTGAALINVPLALDLAQATANLSSVTCSNGRKANKAVLSVTPSIGTAWLGSPSNAGLTSLSSAMSVSSANLVSVPLVANISGFAQIKLGGTTPQSVSFSTRDIADKVAKTVSTNDAISSIATSLIANTQLQVNALGIGLPLTPLTTAVGSALNTAAPSLDSFLANLTGLLGVGVGQATVQINGVRCGVPMLVS